MIAHMEKTSWVLTLLDRMSIVDHGNTLRAVIKLQEGQRFGNGGLDLDIDGRLLLAVLGKMVFGTEGPGGLEPTGTAV